ncbi:hypothetical protein PIROE2DRAFT_2105 [Piromyces sp. E2]|nr:hypothetical protein PIROE2DRAFT_2105 [Piromyces sp. E2]|eukprot:OUM69909.1 hypothetical protein PIROE2DRAFT_2105 [Piromyces sp. E2]
MFLEIVLSLFYKNTHYNRVQQIKHKNVVSFLISDYIDEIFNENPHNCFLKKEIITNIINEISQLEFYNAFCDINNVINSQFKYNIHSVLCNKSSKKNLKKNTEPKSGVYQHHMDI